MNPTNPPNPQKFTPGRRPRNRLLSYAGPALISAGAAAVFFALVAALSTVVPTPAPAVPDSALLRPAQDPHEQEPRGEPADCAECVRGQHGWESVV